MLNCLSWKLKIHRNQSVSIYHHHDHVPFSFLFLTVTTGKLEEADRQTDDRRIGIRNIRIVRV